MERPKEDYGEFCKRLAREELRDKFAMAALTGMLGNPDYDFDSTGDASEVAYRYADAMLKARGASHV